MHDEASSSSSSSFSSSSFFFLKTKPSSKTLQKLQRYTSVLRPCFLHQAKKKPRKKNKNERKQESVTECLTRKTLQENLEKCVFPNSWSASSPVRLRKLRFWWKLLVAVAVTYPKWNSLQQQQQLQQAVWGGGGGSDRSKQTVDRKPRERNWGKEECVATEARCGEVSKRKTKLSKTQQKQTKLKKTQQNSTKQKSAKLNKTLLLLLLLLLILA